MFVLSAEHLTKSYSEKILLRDVSLLLDEKDKAGLIGVNGTGKSTLLKILAGAETPDGGVLTIPGGVRVGYLPQNPVFQKDLPVLEQVFLGISQKDRETQEYEAKAILTRLGLQDLQQPVGQLSGGQKKRVAMAGALIHPCDLLILDEPTNHLDNEMISWLEQYLIQFRGALLMVTHDRYFLDRVTNRILELDRGSLYSYTANFSKFLELKAQREEMAAASERKRQALVKRELDWIHQGPKARGTKSQYRIDRLKELQAREAEARSEELALGSVASRLGRKTIELDHISKAYDGKALIRDFSYNFQRRARIGIVGKNGCGKSTLLSIIAGRLTPDSGEVIVGETVKVGFFSQEGEEMDPSMRVIDYIREHGEYVETTEGRLSAAQMLEQFLFPSDCHYQQIGRLSGGERRRLFLLRILIEAPNILLLDEPTNDLDIQTLMILEQFLESFQGAVIAVAHDRYFLDKVADHIFRLDGEGNVQVFLGGYSDYLLQLEDEEVPRVSKAAKPKAPRSEQPKKLKFTFKEQREYETIDDDIAALEEQIAGKEREIEASSSDFERLQQLLEEKETLEAALSEKEERWLYLTELAEKINNQ
ncbi:MAG: ABC-F family ATP-binding cassette domain-containing protein [Oscillospiraceae bacterium]|nr:ABC-F family ATP-binding cassette domain-containing protein [Oscillospiraceae bacterium]